jgi:hypothetical protein
MMPALKIPIAGQYFLFSFYDQEEIEDIQDVIPPVNDNNHYVALSLSGYSGNA